ncbi:hypothetical protein P8631_10820 [Guyparkeria sp. 1SP6A2]|nr:hypothetical protein [Guyparkeria sp. 1SP6A2]
MKPSSQGFRETLRPDPVVLALWLGLLVAACLSLGLLAWQWPFPAAGERSSSGLGAGWRLVIWSLAVLGLWRMARRAPAGFARGGRLIWSDGHVAFEPWHAPPWRGEARLVWVSVVLVGLRIEDPVSGRLTLWLTPRRLGAAGWWRLQRFLTLSKPG